MTRWCYGIHTYRFQDVGKNHRQLRKELGVQEIMVYVRRRVVAQIGHLARKSPQDPAKQLLFGFVSERDRVFRYRRRGRGRQTTQPPKMIKKHYEDTLQEIVCEGFDFRMWPLLAQDRNYWKRLVKLTDFSEPIKGAGPQGPSTATTSRIRHTEELEEAGETETVMSATGRRSVRSKCPLRCGWRGCQITKHIAAAHPLHPVTFRCTGCDQSFDTRVSVNYHLRYECVEASIVTVIRQSNVYKWDTNAGFLRTYPPDAAHDASIKPYPEGWLTNKNPETKQQTREVMAELGAVQDDKPLAEGVRVWNGERGTEMVERSEQRQQILNEADTDDVDNLATAQRRMFYRTMACTHSGEHMGWGLPTEEDRWRAPRLRLRVRRWLRSRVVENQLASCSLLRALAEGPLAAQGRRAPDLG